MASVRFTDVQSRPTEFLDFTSLTLEEFQTLVLAFQAHMAVWRLDGKPRAEQSQQRRLPVTSHPSCPCPAARACGLPAADRAG